MVDTTFERLSRQQQVQAAAASLYAWRHPESLSVKPKRVRQNTQLATKVNRSMASSLSRSVGAAGSLAAPSSQDAPSNFAGGFLGVLSGITGVAGAGLGIGLYLKERQRGLAQKKWQAEQEQLIAQALAQGLFTQQDVDAWRQKQRPQGNNGTSGANTKIGALALTTAGSIAKTSGAALSLAGGIGAAALGAISIAATVLAGAACAIFLGVYAWLRFRAKSQAQIDWDKANPDGGPKRVSQKTNFWKKMLACGMGLVAVVASLFFPPLAIAAAVAGLGGYIYCYVDNAQKETKRETWEKEQEEKKTRQTGEPAPSKDEPLYKKIQRDCNERAASQRMQRERGNSRA